MQLNMLEAMNIYVNVVEQGSFIRAAEVLELHRPAVTRAVQNLEHDLGVKLLHRTTRQVSMTDEGEEFYQRCLSLLSELDDVRRLFSRTQPPKGRLRLDVPITLARAVIIPALGDFQNRYPDIEIVLGTSDRKIDLIAERVDCVIRLGELNDSSFVARRLGTAAMVTCAAPSYLAKHGTPHSIDELMKSHRAVNFFSNHSLQIMEWKFTVDGSIASIKIPSSILVDNSEAFLSCGLAGLGVLHGLRPSLAPFIASGELTEILTDFPPPPKPVSLLYPDRQYLAPNEGGTLPGTALGTFSIVPLIADSVKSVPVMAAGGITDSRTARAAHALGAEGVFAGSVFIGTEESRVPQSVKDKIINANGLDLLLFRTLPDYYRSLPGKLADKLVSMDKAGASNEELAQTMEGLRGLRIGMLEGNTDEGYIALGTGIGNIRSIKSVAEVVNELAIC
ncbi:LysR family transcriptional regulator [Salmonella enterica subsp. enterica serovar Rubislaw]|nr:LysR family transcriptional regulator [Salmonella enterica]ECZ7726063.1 LysR family transcriptional regulator [Salmonella enterica subsp. enterica serovar Rubislaw]EED5431811.1 LysR family transcriptional regulator [Salmonella enterica subsp. enterica serovar Rubislaw]